MLKTILPVTPLSPKVGKLTTTASTLKTNDAVLLSCGVTVKTTPGAR